MLTKRRIRSKALKRLFAEGDASGVDARWLERVKLILNALDAAVAPEELRMPGWRLHELKGARRGTYSVRVTGNQRITFRWDDSGPYEVDLEDYHG